MFSKSVRAGQLIRRSILFDGHVLRTLTIRSQLHIFMQARIPAVVSWAPPAATAPTL
jgi:hypothetical protein